MIAYLEALRSALMQIRSCCRRGGSFVFYAVSLMLIFARARASPPPCGEIIDGAAVKVD